MRKLGAILVVVTIVFSLTTKTSGGQPQEGGLDDREILEILGSNPKILINTFFCVERAYPSGKRVSGSISSVVEGWQYFRILVSEGTILEDHGLVIDLRVSKRTLVWFAGVVNETSSPDLVPVKVTIPCAEVTEA